MEIVGETDDPLTKYENCTESGSRGRVDYFCERKPSEGCLNFVAKVDKTAEPNLNGKGKVNKTPATRAYCTGLNNKFKAAKNSDDPAEMQKAIAAGQELLNRCGKSLPNAIAAVKEGVGNLRQKTDENSSSQNSNPANGDANQDSDLSEQSNAQIQPKSEKQKIMEQIAEISNQTHLI